MLTVGFKTGVSTQQGTGSIYQRRYAPARYGEDNFDPIARVKQLIMKKVHDAKPLRTIKRNWEVGD